MPGSGNVLIDAIAGVGWLSRGGNNQITYYFNNSLGFHSWTSTERTAYQAALQQFANVANITTQEVFSPVGADMNENWVSNAYMLANFGDFAGFHRYPFNPGPATGYYNLDRSYFNAAGLSPGGLGFQILMHEIGHGLGLAHTHDTDMGTGVLPGVINSSDLGTLSYNQNLYSIMSYNNGPSLSSGSNNYGHAATLMAFDIAAIQLLYGANTTYHAGSDTYSLPTSNAVGATWQCIWDAGGIDTISCASSVTGATIDLRPATLVNGDPNAGGFVSQIAGIFGGFTVANGVVIENATGGSGNDTINGNSVANLIFGNDGSDSILANAGRDTVDGGSGNNTIVGGRDSADGADLILTGGGSDLLFGNGGTDTINAGDGNNIVVGGFGSDVLTCGGGADAVYCNQDNDTILAGGGADTIVAGFGNDSVLGGDGNDLLIGSEGNDTLVGGSGADLYMFFAGFGVDQIFGFAFGEGDRISLQGQSYTLGSSSDGDALLLLSGGGTI